MLASILAALTTISKLVSDLIALFKKTATEKSQDSKEAIRKEMEELKKTGRPPQ